MSYELFIGLRYLKAKRKQTFVSLITLISIAGVMVGVTALIVVIAVMNGFKEDLRDKILGVTSHVVISRFDGNISKYQEVRAKVGEVSGVNAATPFIYTQVMISSRKAISGAVLRGIEPKTASKVINLPKNMRAGSLEELEAENKPEGMRSTPGIILGNELARNIGALRGEPVTVISPLGRLTPLGRVPRSQTFRVAGIFDSGMYEYDSTIAYVSLWAAQRFLGIGDRVTGIEVRVDDIYEADRVAKAIGKALDGYPYWSRDWMRMNKNLFSALKLEKIVMFIILTLIILVAAFNIVGTLIMVVIEKTRDIAILKSMGATRRSIMKIFMIEGAVIGLVGTLLGLLGGYTLCKLLATYKFIELPSDVYYISTLPVQMNPLDVAIIALAAIVITLAASVYPAWQASRFDPAEAIRYE
ncbi:MAG: lipoprotein-releasing ABC transporter permease subunit [Deltaproteobacteria bacterium]|jgi:lipoprotein-releasing system permease protein|nr:lipoprotein-releasing ABC transporter permease subunit [Deltaproteobacteria bacterium]MDH3773972.1 lipoprotein-releasing ABC transporter permease subunit [Deltaproteobacteria bacterium]MDH3849920.1 lipoprotein-releasing ABC transporter permease subunit [Deltaproteobacteria bacterium]MDH3928472.1 lipoprotein-releasing ABC transporter permease subunit [Deltaproteobacteria bacterium]MDH3950076.1 lipoprotein-releasing ABC transporter permease subunit [Deltaproteobacteria bacterium]